MSDKYLREVSKRPLFRVIAILCVLLILGLIIATLVTGITGSEYFMGFLALTIIVPVFIYVVLWIGRVLYDSTNSRKKS